MKDYGMDAYLILFRDQFSRGSYCLTIFFRRYLAIISFLRIERELAAYARRGDLFGVSPYVLGEIEYFRDGLGLGDSSSILPWVVPIYVIGATRR